jgi:DNA-binding transcriptional ArsR family regulator
VNTNGVVLDALGDPTRRQILEALRRGPRSVGELAGGLPVSRPAVSQHLRVLKEAGLVADRKDGTRRVYRIDPGGLAGIRAYFDSFWDEALERFAAEARKEQE